MNHVSDEEILDLLSPGDPPGPEIRAHLEGCPECRARIEAERSLSARLDDLPREVDPPRDLWPDVRESVEAETPLAEDVRPAWVRPALRAAAAVAIFVLGAAVGRSLGPEAPETDPYGSDDPFAAAAAVQRAGTDYVTAVARFRAVAAESSSPVVEQARDAALAAVHGAAWELSRLRPGDATAREMVALAGAGRLAEEAP